MDVVDSPGRQTDARAELERRVVYAADTAAAAFLTGVCRDALAAVDGTVMVASAVEPFTLSQVMTRWGPAAERIAAAVVKAAGSVESPGVVDRAYWAKVQARVAASDLPLDVHRDVRDTLTGPLASRLDGRPDRGKMKAALRASLRAPRERSQYRAQVERIARTETTSMFGYATQAKLAGEGVPGKRWVAHHDARTRPSHAAANGQVVAVEEPFLVGGYALMHPGDPSGPVKETASCRCVMNAVKRFASTVAAPPPPPKPRPVGEMATRPPVGSWMPHGEILFKQTQGRVLTSKAEHDAFTARLKALPSDDPKFTPWTATDDYMSGSYREMNGYLQGSETPWNPAKTAQQITQMDRAFDEAGTMNETYMVVKRGVHRGENFDPATFYREGDVLQEAGYVSTALEDTRSFAGADGWTMDIMVPPGHRYVYGTYYERELIFDRGMTQRVVKVDSDARRIWLEVEPPE